MKVHSWAALQAEAAKLGLLFFCKMASVKELKEELEEKSDRAEAIKNLVAQNNGEWSDELKGEWSALMDEGNGEIAQIAQRLQAAMKLEGEEKRLATLRLAQQGGSNPLAGTKFDIQTGTANPDDMVDQHEHFHYSKGRLNCFPNTAKGREDAYVAATHMRAVIAECGGKRDDEALEFLANRNIEVQMVATEGDSGSGGYLVPEPAESAFIERREQVGVMAQLAERQTMTSSTLTVPKLLSGPAVTYPGETGEGTESDQTWGNVNLTATERMILSYVSNRLRSDASINVVDQFMSRMAYEAAKQDDNEAINGDGTSTYGREVGLLAALGAAGVAGAASGHDTWPELDLADMILAMALLPDEFWQDPVWLCSASFYHSVMLRIQAAAGGNTIATLEAGGSARPLFLGRPVYFTGRMPRTTGVSQVSCLFGNFRESVKFGVRAGLMVATSEHVRFTANQLAIRGVYRQDWNVHEGGDASNAGGYVGVKTAS